MYVTINPIECVKIKLKGEPKIGYLNSKAGRFEWVREFEAVDSRSLSKGCPRLRDDEEKEHFELSQGDPRLLSKK
jgi:hypothetical protein